MQQHMNVIPLSSYPKPVSLRTPNGPLVGAETAGATSTSGNPLKRKKLCGRKCRIKKKNGLRRPKRS